MARPTKTDLASDQQGWDATMNDNLAKLFTSPYPIPEVADLATLTSTYPAANYDGCIARAADNQKAYYSDGTDWLEVPVGASLSVSSWTAYDTPSDVVEGWTGAFTSVAAEWRQVGGQYEVRGYILLSGAVTPSNTPLQFNLPSELSLTPVSPIGSSVYWQPVGSWALYDNNLSTWRQGPVVMHNNFFGPAVLIANSGITAANAYMEHDQPITFGTNDMLTFHFTVEGA